MTNPVQPKPNPLPAILVYGTPSGPALTQASWFRAEDKEAVKAAAAELKFPCSNCTPMRIGLRPPGPMRASSKAAVA
jgi:hypothetical protein